ncbi:MAG: hypothetical protein DI565_12690 [Ancylobacter novellus]|uniref:Amino acid transporter n=1 Tax=Ancylobacter novellus TaxID=921 RepID=A0A2W5KAV4_ANCNO|nr:MAG: hypothetical protein DI565_12690 [Ancylobacter novellus]
MSLTPDDIERRIKAKRFNERLKLFASTLNTIGLTLFGSAVVIPFVAGALTTSVIVWIMLAVALHLSAQTGLKQLRSED